MYAVCVGVCSVLTSPRSTISHTTSIKEAPGCDGLGEPLVDAPRDSAAEAAAALAAAAAVVGAAPAGAGVVAGAACTVLVAGLGLAGLGLAAVDALLLLLLLLATAVVLPLHVGGCWLLVHKLGLVRLATCDT